MSTRIPEKQSTTRLKSCPNRLHTRPSFSVTLAKVKWAADALVCPTVVVETARSGLVSTYRYTNMKSTNMESDHGVMGTHPGPPKPITTHPHK